MPQISYAKVALGLALGLDADTWLEQQVADGRSNVEIQQHVAKLIGAPVQYRTVYRWTRQLREGNAA